MNTTMPPLTERLRLTAALLKLAKRPESNFDTIWANGGGKSLSVAHIARDTPRRPLSWAKAKELVDGKP